jgi:hypothetical protein
VTNPSVMEPRRPMRATRRVLTHGWYLAVTTPLLVGLVLALGILGAHLATAGVGEGITWGVVIAGLLALPFHVWQHSKLQREGRFRPLLDLSRRDRARVLGACRRGEDVGEARLAPTVLAYLRAEAQDEEDEGFRGTTAGRLLVPVGIAVLLAFASVQTGGGVRILAGAAAIAVLAAAGLSLVAASQRGSRRQRAWELAMARVDEAERTAEGRRMLASTPAGPAPVLLAGAWASEAPLWSVAANDRAGRLDS